MEMVLCDGCGLRSPRVLRRHGWACEYCGHVVLRLRRPQVRRWLGGPTWAEQSQPREE